MSVASRITSMTEHIQNAYDSIERFGVDTESIDKNLVNLSNTITNEIYDKLPKVSGNGSNFTLENTQNGKLDLFEMEGNTYQDSYTGKNLFDINSVTSITNGSISNEIITTNETSNSSYSVFPYFPNTSLPANTYYLSMDIRIKSGTGTFNKINDAAIEWTGVSKPTISSNFQRYVYSHTYTENTTLNHILIQFVNSTNAIYEIKNIMLSTSSDTTYEPFVGGSPSPSPDYPQNIEVVENEQTVNVHGKNLVYNFANTWYSTDSNTFTNSSNFKSCKAKVKPNTTYTISKKNISNRYVIFTSEVDIVPGTPLGRQVLVKGNPDFTNYTFTTQNNENYIFFGYIASTNAEEIARAEEEIMVEENPTATTYEPYHNKDYEIDLGDIKLCEIEDYKDAIFKNNQLSEYYDSTLDENSWYIKKEIGKTTFSGNDFSSFSVNTVTSTFCQFLTLPIDDILPSISNGGSLNNLTSHLGGTTPTKKIRINISHESLGTTSSSTTGEAKTALVNKMSGKTMICYYILATPTYEKITNSTLISQLEAIETETGTNIFEVSNDNDVLPSLNVKRLKELEKLS